MNRILRTLMMLLVMGWAYTGYTQEEDKQGKIHIKITKDINGEKKTFEGTYNNEKEMRNDPAYREFAGEDENAFLFRFDELDKLMEMHEGFDPQTFAFDFDMDEMMPGLKRFKYRGQSPGWFDKGHHSFEPGIEELEELEEELDVKMEDLESKLEDLDESLKSDILSDLEAIEEIYSKMGGPKRIKRTQITVEEAGDAFGKLAKVKAPLELDKLNFKTLHNRLMLKFDVPEQDQDLAVRIYNADEQAIYSRYFEQFGGTFSDQIDFSPYSEGEYLLEISQGKKQLFRKIVIEK